MPKKNPQKSHNEWTEIHLITIRQLVKIQSEKEDLETKKVKLEEEKAQQEEENVKLRGENLKLQEEKVRKEMELRKYICAEEEKTNMQEDAKQFSAEKPIKVLISGDSHLNNIPMGKLSTVTGREVTRIKTYCSRNFWPGALKLEHKTCDILAAERLWFMIFDNWLITESFQKAICMLKW